MTTFGYTLSSENRGPADLVAFAGRAEESGFDFVSISDHYHPWTRSQGHSPFVWSVLGAIAQTTERIEVGVGVTCPILRIDPAILAQATATISLLFGERFSWGSAPVRRSTNRWCLPLGQSLRSDARCSKKPSR